MRSSRAVVVVSGGIGKTYCSLLFRFCVLEFANLVRFRRRMFIRPPSWADDALRAAASSTASSSSSPGGAQSPIVDLMLSLTNQRLDREVSLLLRTGLRDAKAEFSFMRVRGLKSLTRFLTSAVKSEKIVELFQDTQKYRELQVVPVLFEHTLAPSKSEDNNPVVVGAPSRNEIGLALRILEGCCLLDVGSRQCASRYAAAKVLMALLLSGEPPEQTACLDALLAVLLDSTSNQKARLIYALYPEKMAIAGHGSRGLQWGRRNQRRVVILYPFFSCTKYASFKNVFETIQPRSHSKCLRSCEFERLHGVRKIAELVKSASVDVGVRLKCSEFLLLLIGHVLPANARHANGFQHAEGRQCVVTFEGARQDAVDILGRRCSEVLDAMTRSELANLDFDEEQTSLRTLSQRLVALC